jgi:hypothetical protein
VVTSRPIDRMDARLHRRTRAGEERMGCLECLEGREVLSLSA